MKRKNRKVRRKARQRIVPLVETKPTPSSPTTRDEVDEQKLELHLAKTPEELVEVYRRLTGRDDLTVEEVKAVFEKKSTEGSSPSSTPTTDEDELSEFEEKVCEPGRAVIITGLPKPPQK